MSIIETEKPRTLDYEAELLNHLSRKESVELLIREGVTVQLLYAPMTKSAFQFTLAYYEENGTAPTPEVLATEFPNVTFEEPNAEVNWVVDKLQQRYKKNRVEETLLDAGKKLVENPDEAMQFLRERVIEVDTITSSERTIFKIGDHEQHLAELHDRIIAGAFKGVSVGYKEVDQFTGGIKDGQVGYIMARPKLKKTFNWLMAFIQQVQDGERPFLYTLENSKDEVLRRLDAMLSGYPWDKLQRGELEPGASRLITNAWDKFNSDAEAYFIDSPVDDERTVPAMFARAQKYNATSILISQFAYIHGTRDFYRQEHEKYAEIAKQLKRYSVSTGLPVYVECQFNRGGDNMTDLMDFDASKVGLTDAIPQSADVLYGLFSNAELREAGLTEFGILLARDHDRAAWYVRSELKSTTMFELQPNSEH